MSLPELLRFALKGLTGHGLRTALSLLGVSIGIAIRIVPSNPRISQLGLRKELAEP